MINTLLNKIKDKLFISNLILWIIATVFIVLLKGYRFIWSDQAVYFLNPMRLADPSFITNDWFTWQTAHFHIAFTYYTLFLLKLGHFQTAVFINYILFSFLFAVSLWALVNFVIPNSNFKKIIYLIALIILMSMQIKSIGDTFFKSFLFLAQDMSWPFLILSTVYLLKEKYIISGVMLGIAGLLHFNVLIVGLAVTSIFFCLQCKKNSNLFLLAKRSAILTFASCAIASPAIYVAFSQFLSAGKGETAIFNYLFSRGAHHLLPRAWPLSQVLNYIALNLGGLLSLYIMSKREEIAGYVSILKYYISVIVLFLFAFIFVEIYPTIFVTRLFLWRIAPILTIFSVVLLSVLLVNSCFSRIKISRALALLLLLVFWIEINNVIILVLTLLFLFLVMQNISEEAVKSDINQIMVFVIVMLLLWVGPFGFAKKQINRKPWASKHVKQLYKYIKKETAKNEIFIIPPLDIELCSFRIVAKRAVFVDYKAVPFRTNEIKEWKKRMDLMASNEIDYFNLNRAWKSGAILSGNDEMNYYELKPSQIIEISRKYNISYFITDRRWLKNKIDFKRSGMRILFYRPNNPYVMYRIPEYKKQ